MSMPAAEMPWPETSSPESGFDPEDWSEFAKLAHRAVDDMVAYLSAIGEQPAWRPVPEATKQLLRGPAPEAGIGLEAAYDEVLEHVVPYPTGNIHPRFWSWVGGTGTPQAWLADIVISALNACNLGFDEMASTYVELQLIDWLKALFGMPDDASGLIVSGGSMANLVGLTVARNVKAGYDVRALGVDPARAPLVFYASSETHSSVRKAVELLGLGTRALRIVPVRRDFTIDLPALEEAIAADRAAGSQPAGLIANAGTVNTGATDPLERLAEISEREGLWLHVDGAFGAMAKASTLAREQVAGLEHADSLAFDLHKWMYQQYDIGCALVRHRQAHFDSFNVTPAYLRKMARGLASGPTDFSAYGVQLSRSAKALRAWLTIRSEGLGKFRALVDQNIRQARYLSARVEHEADLELLAPTALNIVNFRYAPAGIADEPLNEVNREILMALHTRGIATPSSTEIDGRFSIRVAICNHRSRRADFDALVASVLEIGRQLLMI